MQTATITMLPVDDIVFDSSQPRKFFDEAALAELTESIKQVGILQPIMVQPGALIGAKEQRHGYVIICGERRYRAAWQAGLKEVPVVIREGLSPEEVLEIQITENLQRKDVNPMEEGHAFQKLYSRFPIEEIATRVGKSEKYVAQRMSLTDLTDNWQQLVYNGSITLTVAYKLARMGKGQQDEMYKEVVQDGKIQTWPFDNIDRYLDSEDADLARAKFDITDPDLYAEAGACISCRFNSANQPLLFSDAKKAICSNSPCFRIKEGRAYANTLRELVQDPDVLLLDSSYSHSKEEKAKIKEVEALGGMVLERDQFEIIDEPDAPEPWEEFLAECKEDFEYDEMEPSMQKERLKKWKADYDELMQEYEEDIARYREDAAKARDGFIVVGYNQGKRVKVVLKGKGKASKVVDSKGDPDQAELLDIEVEIEGIESRERRNQELDNEKVMKELIDLLKNEEGTFLTSTASVFDELAALIVAMAASDYGIRDFVESATGKSYDYSLNGMYKHLEKLGDIGKENLFVKVARRFMLKNLVSAQEQNLEHNGKAQTLYQLALQHFPNTVEQVEMEQKQKAEKRQANVQKRLQALRAKKDEITEKIRAKNIERGKKAQEAAKSKKSKTK